MLSLNNDRIPFFSVIICTFNRKKIINRAIDSLLKQNFTDWEAIIVDDGSDDNTFELINNYSKNDVRIRYMFHANRGTGNTRNAGILASNGLYITFLDSDDEYEENHLYIRRSALISNPEIELLYGGAKIIGNKYVPDVFNPKKKIHLKNCVIGGTFFFKKETALKVDGFPNLRFGDDTFFYKKISDAGMLIGKIENETYIYHRESEDSICSNLK